MKQITDTIFFDETKTIQEQTSEFQQWFFTNCNITDITLIDSYDNYNRPNKYHFNINNLTINVIPNYINDDITNWAISGYTIEII